MHPVSPHPAPRAALDHELVKKQLKGISEESLKGYKVWLGMPPELIDNHYLSRDNMMDWINVEKFALYLQYLSRQSDENMYSTSAQKMKPSGVELEAAKADQTMLLAAKQLDIIVISDDSDTEISLVNAKGTAKKRTVKRPCDTRPAKQQVSKSKLEVIEILDSSEDEANTRFASNNTTLHGPKVETKGHSLPLNLKIEPKPPIR